MHSIGIDLGTTNSAAALWRNGVAELIPNALGQVLTPSAVSFTDEGEVLVGVAARDRQVLHPDRTATAFKRYMGSERVTTLAGKKYRPEELSALVLTSLKRDAEAYLGEPVEATVITVPAYFNDTQRKATRRAGELAGLCVERLINEPTAAALAYGIHQLANESRFLVFDLGGGTFDVSVLEIFEGVIEVRASTGDNALGGEDFNALLIEDMFRAHDKRWGVAHLTENEHLFQLLRDQAERARRELTSKPSATMTVRWRDTQFQHTVASEDFERLAEPLLERLRAPVVRALRDANLRAEELQEIVLVGGATRMPIIRRSVARMFGRFPATKVHPDEAVALGAGVQVGLKARDVALREVVLTDVCPYTLGIRTSERLPDGKLRSGVFSPIIERNTVIPASRAESFTTVVDGQRRMNLEIFQGESRLVVDNVRLGEIEVPVPAKRAGEISVECRFTYDVNGLLEVDAYVEASDERYQLVISNAASEFTTAEIEQRRRQLAALKVYPRDQAENAAALARTLRAYEQFTGERRELIAKWLGAFESVLAEQDPRAADRARGELHGQLDRLEGERFL